MMRRLCFAVLLAMATPTGAETPRPGAPVAELFREGQWVEIRDLDPTESSRRHPHPVAASGGALVRHP